MKLSAVFSGVSRNRFAIINISGRASYLKTYMKKFRRKPKPYIEATVMGLISKFSKLLSLQRIPIVTFNRQEIRQLIPGRKRNMSGSVYLGTAYISKNVIWINPNHESVDTARDTLAHEMCHLRFPYEGHTPYFYQKVKELLSGKQFKPLKKR